jgi:hypothetical protein
MCNTLIRDRIQRRQDMNGRPPDMEGGCECATVKDREQPTMGGHPSPYTSMSQYYTKDS